MNLTPLEEQTLRDIERDGGRAAARDSYGKTGNRWITRGQRRISLSAVVIESLVAKGALAQEGNYVAIPGKKPRGAQVFELVKKGKPCRRFVDRAKPDMGWIG